MLTESIGFWPTRCTKIRWLTLNKRRRVSNIKTSASAAGLAGLYLSLLDILRLISGQNNGEWENNTEAFGTFASLSSNRHSLSCDQGIMNLCCLVLQQGVLNILAQNKSLH